jgi:predicted enzyme related to lactoylglutathione lyase
MNDLLSLRDAVIGQVGLTVRNVSVAVRFYRDSLGLTLESESGSVAAFRCGATRLLIGLPTGRATQAGTSTLFFRVSDIEATHDALRQCGVAFLTAPRCVERNPHHELWQAHFRDPDGNALGLMSERTPAG